MYVTSGERPSPCLERDLEGDTDAWVVCLVEAQGGSGSGGGRSVLYFKKLLMGEILDQCLTALVHTASLVMLRIEKS